VWIKSKQSGCSEGFCRKRVENERAVTGFLRLPIASADCGDVPIWRLQCQGQSPEGRTRPIWHYKQSELSLKILGREGSSFLFYDREILLQSISRYYQFLSRPQRETFFVGDSPSVMSEIPPKNPRVRLDNDDYRQMDVQILN
jgi:hypothetical protein